MTSEKKVELKPSLRLHSARRVSVDNTISVRPERTRSMSFCVFDGGEVFKNHFKPGTAGTLA